MDVCRIERRDSPIIASFPHSGTVVPPDLRARLTKSASPLPDTDWRVPDLYDFLPAIGVTTIVANLSRYVVDLNRPPQDAELYADHPSTGVCPTLTFFGDPIYQPGCEPNTGETKVRIERYWRPYHDALAELIEANIRKFGLAVIYDAHSIAPVIPRLFEGELPALNLGTANGRSCAEVFERPVREAVSGGGFSYAVNGRFVGGYITRHYGRPEQGCHAMQMEISQRAYLNKGKPSVNAPRARLLRQALRAILGALTDAVEHSLATPASAQRRKSPRRSAARFRGGHR